MIDLKLGKRGEYRPTLTVSGNMAYTPYITVHQLTDDYYVVGDIFPSVDVTEELERLMAVVNELEAE